MAKPPASDPIELCVLAHEAGARLDHFLVARVESMSRAEAARLAAARRVLVGGRPAQKRHVLREGDRVSLLEAPRRTDFVPLAAEVPGVRIVHADDAIVVVEKAGGVPTHPLRAGELGTVANALERAFPGIAASGGAGRAREAGLVHRLDAGTSGLLLAARSAEVHRTLRAALAAGALEKAYVALCVGTPDVGRVLSGAIASHPKSARKVVVREASRSADVRDGAVAPRTTTIVDAQPVVPGWSLVRVRAPRAARHQVRAHLAAAGHPLAGDSLYGGAPVPGLDRHFLHAETLSFRHPRTGEVVTFSSALPPDLARVLDRLRAGA